MSDALETALETAKAETIDWIVNGILKEAYRYDDTVSIIACRKIIQAIKDVE